MIAPQICIVASYAKPGSNGVRMVVENYLADNLFHFSKILKGLGYEGRAASNGAVRP